MNKKQEAFDALKMAYLEVDVPDTLDDAIQRGIVAGQNHVNRRKYMQDKKRNRGGMRAIAAIAAAFLVLIASVNISPAFAEQLSGIPIIGQLVKVLIFTDGSAIGGTITDGSDVSAVSTDKKGVSETFTIHFEQGEQPQALAGAYKVSYAQNPETLSFQISGVRMFSALEDFEAMKQSGLVEDVYRVITLDDSMIRFVMVFKEPVRYEIKEMQNPASLILEVSPKGDETANTTPYRLRTMEMPFGESLGITEEMLMPNYTDMRILRTATDSENYFIELGQFESQSSAEDALEKAKVTYPDMAFGIEAVLASPVVTESGAVEAVNKLGPGIIDTLSEKAPHLELEKTIIEALQIPDEEAMKTMYLYNYVDLNADGTEEILVLLIGPYTSGSGGSTAIHVLQNSDGLQVNQIMTLIQEPIIISDKITKGCHEMVVYRSGGGAEGGYVALTSSDGQYKSVNDGAPLATLEGITGKAIMSNDILKDMEDGSVLYLKK